MDDKNIDVNECLKIIYEIGEDLRSRDINYVTLNTIISTLFVNTISSSIVNKVFDEKNIDQMFSNIKECIKFNVQEIKTEKKKKENLEQLTVFLKDKGIFLKNDSD